MVKYIPGNSNNPIIFNTYEIGIGSGNPYVTKWKYRGTQKQYGLEINQFEKDPISLPLVFRFRGSLKEIKKNLDLFFQECEKDILLRKAGTLWINDWSIRGYFIERETIPSEEFYGNEMSAIFLAPYPFWTKTIEKEFSKQSTIEGDIGLDFDFDFAFDFAADETGRASWNVDHYTKSHFKMKIYGPVDKPKILVNDYPYQIHTTLKAGEYLTIDSRDNTVIKYLYDGKIEDIYNSRDFEYSVFEKMPSGLLNIIWSGEFGFELALFLERSEPKW